MAINATKLKHQYQAATGSNQEVAGLTMMDSLVNNLRMIVVVELQTFVCIAINLLLIDMVTLLTALLVGVIVCLHRSWLWLCRIHTKCALLPYKGKYSTL